MSAPGDAFALGLARVAAMEWLLEAHPWHTSSTAANHHIGVLYSCAFNDAQKWFKHFQDHANQAMWHADWPIDKVGAWFEVSQ